MPRPHRQALAVTTQPAPPGAAGMASPQGAEQLRALVKARNEANRPAGPGFRERLAAWLEQEL